MSASRRALRLLPRVLGGRPSTARSLQAASAALLRSVHRCVHVPGVRPAALRISAEKASTRCLNTPSGRPTDAFAPRSSLLPRPAQQERRAFAAAARAWPTRRAGRHSATLRALLTALLRAQCLRTQPFPCPPCRPPCRRCGVLAPATAGLPGLHFARRLRPCSLAHSLGHSQGNIARWLKKEGDKVAAGDVLAEIETVRGILSWKRSRIRSHTLLSGGRTRPRWRWRPWTRAMWPRS